MPWVVAISVRFHTEALSRTGRTFVELRANHTRASQASIWIRRSFANPIRGNEQGKSFPDNLLKITGWVGQQERGN